MSVLHVNHIQANCRSRFTSLIDMSDVTTANPADKDDKFLSRALAAFAISALAQVDDTVAAKAVVDEYHDDGIDAFFYDPNEHIGYLLQSKWIKDGNGSIDLATALKFKQGVDHFFANNVSSLGTKMQAKKSEIQSALDDSAATFVLVFAYTGNNPLAVEVATPIDEWLVNLNDDGDLVRLHVLKQHALHEIVVQKSTGVAVDLTVLLHDYGQVKQPYQAYYGQVDVSDIALWGTYGDRLYHKNIRGFKGSTDVNVGIVTTLKDDADSFFYFNNGITLLCAGLDKRPLGGASTISGVFDCTDVSVINGAQTVGSIISALQPSGSPMVPAPSSARVMVKLISLANCPADFSIHATRAANTQNRIENRDFASLDPEQKRLRDDLLLSLGKEYVFRTGDQPPDPDLGCSLDEAAVALACAHADVTHAVNAKQAIGRFFEDITKPPYTYLFNAGLSAIKLWRAVEVMRKVDSLLKAEQKERDGKERGCAVHGNRVLLHLVFRKLSPTIFNDSTNLSDEIEKVPPLVPSLLDNIAAEITKYSPPSYVGNVFKNITKCKAIVAEIA